MKKVFLDTNIMLDLLGKRYPYFDAIAKIATLAVRGDLLLVVSALSYSTVDYVLEKTEKHEDVIYNLQKFKMISTVSDLNDAVIEKALNSDFEDFEDALQYFCALQSKTEVILTRNSKDFKLSTIPTMTADEFLKVI
ncbi:MAG: PIN domain-containing protein [Paludibacter sp.]|jgi:predicted nucleic acid-binding protein|nr:PIN domain-containing protein [Paludibacter sp.]